MGVTYNMQPIVGGGSIGGGDLYHYTHTMWEYMVGWFVVRTTIINHDAVLFLIPYY